MGNLIPQTKGVDGVPRVARTPQNEEAVLQAFEEDDTLSIRSAASMFNISKAQHSGFQKIIDSMLIIIRVYKISCLKIFP
jgi:hypothetical protein